MTALNPVLSLFGRILLSAIFIMGGFSKLQNPAGTAGYMKTSLYPLPQPELLVWGVIGLELLGGLAILFGFLSRSAALALAVFTLVAAVLFHWKPGDQVQHIMFMKNLAIAGGLMLLAANGPGRWGRG